MVMQPFSPPVLPSDYNQDYFSPPPYTSFEQSSRKRKRQYDNEDDFVLTDLAEKEHITKKHRDEVVVPLTPTSPPTSFSSFQRSSASVCEFSHALPPHPTHKDVVSHLPPPSYVAYPPPQELSKSHPSDVDITIPSQNLFLRNLHMNSRAYQLNQNRFAAEDKDEEMWVEEEEIVAERYSAMNKILGSRKLN
jgi:hypothetical protein